MKKVFLAMMSLLLILGLAACGSTAKPTDSDKDKGNKKGDSAQSDLTLEEVFEKSLKASEEMKSFHAKMDIKQEVEHEGSPLNVDVNMDMDVIVDPMALYQKTTTKMEADGESIAEGTLNTETYLTDEGFFMYLENEDTWAKFPSELSDQLMQIPNSQSNPAEQLEQLKTFVEDFSFEQNDKEFILKLTASGEKFEAFLKETALNALPEQMKANEEIINSMKINNVEYEIFIDKENFYTTGLNMIMDSQMKVEEYEIKLHQEMTGTYSNINGIDQIKVPQEAIDNAEEINM